MREVRKLFREFIAKKIVKDWHFCLANIFFSLFLVTNFNKNLWNDVKVGKNILEMYNMLNLICIFKISFNYYQLLLIYKIDSSKCTKFFLKKNSITSAISNLYLSNLMIFQYFNTVLLKIIAHISVYIHFFFEKQNLLPHFSSFPFFKC